MHSQSLVSMLVGLAAAVATYATLSPLLASTGPLPTHQWAASTTTASRPLSSGPIGARSHPSVLGQLLSAPSRQPRPLDSASVGTLASSQRQVVPVAGVMATIFGAVLFFRRLFAPSPAPMATLATTGGSADDLIQNVKAQLESAKSQFEGVRDEVVPKLKSQFETAKSQVQTARDQVQSLQKQLEGAKADMVPKLQAELDKSKAGLEAARSQLRSASAQVTRILGDDSPLPEEAKVGWLMQNAIGLGGLVAQLWLSAVSTIVGVLAAQLVGTGSGVWAGLLFTSVSIAASWYSAYWCFESHGIGKRLIGDSGADVPSRDSVLRHLWDGLTVNALGLIAAMVGIQINTGVLFTESLNAGILNNARTASGVIHKGVSAFDVFAQLAQSQALLSLSIGLLLTLLTLRVASRPKPATA